MTQDPRDSDLLGETPEDQALPSTPALDEETPFATMMSSFDEAAQTVGVDPAEYQILRKSDREIAFSVPVRLDGILRVEHTPTFESSRVRVIFTASPLEALREVPERAPYRDKVAGVDKVTGKGRL